MQWERFRDEPRRTVVPQSLTPPTPSPKTFLHHSAIGPRFTIHPHILADTPREVESHSSVPIPFPSLDSLPPPAKLLLETVHKSSGGEASPFLPRDGFPSQIPDGRASRGSSTLPSCFELNNSKPAPLLPSRCRLDQQPWTEPPRSDRRTPSRPAMMLCENTEP